MLAGSFGGRRRYHGDVDQFEAEAGDPLHQSLESALIRAFGAQRGRVRAHADFAVVKFCPHYRARLAGESDLVCSCLHHFAASQPAISHGAPSMPGGRACVLTFRR